jgi:hypothetical protein
LQRKIGVSCGERCDEGIFERLDGPFSGVDAMVVWLDQLQFAFVVGEKLFVLFCGLIVHHINFRLVPFQR